MSESPRARGIGAATAPRATTTFARPRYNAAPEAAIPDDRDGHRRDRLLDRAVAAHERAIAWRGAGRYAEAERACRRALAGYEAAEGRRHVDVANALVELAAILEPRDRPAEARRALVRALDILQAPTRDLDLVRLRLHAQLALSGLDRARAAYRDADRRLRRALGEARRRLPPRDPLVASIWNNLGVLRKAEGRYAEAAACYRRARPLLGRRDRDAHATLAHNLGGIEHARGRPAQAEPHARRAVELREAAHGRAHPAVAADLAALAAVVEARGRLTEAAALYRRALAIFRRTFGARSLERGLTLAGLAAVEQQRGRAPRARQLYGQALPLLTARLGPDHPDVALTLNNLAVLERDAGRLARAEALFGRAEDKLRRSAGARHPHTRLAAENRRAVQQSRTDPRRARTASSNRL